jgi:hypothetical protein
MKRMVMETMLMRVKIPRMADVVYQNRYPSGCGKPIVKVVESKVEYQDQSLYQHIPQAAQFYCAVDFNYRKKNEGED